MTAGAKGLGEEFIPALRRFREQESQIGSGRRCRVDSSRHARCVGARPPRSVRQRSGRHRRAPAGIAGRGFTRSMESNGSWPWRSDSRCMPIDSSRATTPRPAEGNRLHLGPLRDVDHSPPPHGSSIAIRQSPLLARRNTSALRPTSLTGSPSGVVPSRTQRFATSATSPARRPARCRHARKVATPRSPRGPCRWLHGR